jgi:hypothetical protein
MIFNRFFQIWSYTPSLSILYLRSNKQNKNDITIDLAFYATNYINLPTSIHLKSISRFDATKNIEKNQIIYEIVDTDGQLFYITASKCIVGQSTMEYDEHPTISNDYVYNSAIVL